MKTKTSRVLLAFWAVQVCVAADLQQQVDELIPTLAADPVESRYAYQMQLQDLAARASRPGAEAERSALAQILADRIIRPTTPQPAAVWMARQLEYMGRDEAVGALTRLLDGSDRELRECARRALEKNNAPAAADSLRQALRKATDPDWQIGLLNSVGEQHDPQAVSLVVPFLDQPGTAAVAAMALGKIASPDATSALTKAWQNRQPNAGDALVRAADELVARNEKDQAKAILSRLYEPGQPVELRAAALTGLIQVSPDQAGAWVTRALQGDTPELRQVAIQAAAAQPRQLLPVLVRALPDLPGPAQMQALDVVDASAEKVVQQLARSEEGPVRLASLHTLGRIGGAASVPVLIQAAAAEAAPEKAVAQAALACLSGAGVNEVILSSAGQGAPSDRAVAIRAITDRNQKDALPQLIAFAAERDEVVNTAALSALRSLGSDKEVKSLAQMVAQTGSAAAGAALKSVVGRAENKAAAGQIVVEISRSARGESLALLMDVLSVVGGDQALAVLKSQLAGPDEMLKTAALRALGNWPDFAAADPLLRIAMDPQTESTQQILAIRGLAQLVRTSTAVDAERRVQLARKAMGLAKRAEEKRLLISALGTVGHAAAAGEIQALLSDQELRQEAAQAGLQLAEVLLQSDPAKGKALAKAILDADISPAINKSARKMVGR